jgi:hypothetical protein
MLRSILHRLGAKGHGKPRSPAAQQTAADRDEPGLKAAYAS